jgi:putative addiction module component (TIGR02574 family)
MRTDEEISEEEWNQLWAEEAERRYTEYKAGRMEAVPAEEVFACLRTRRSDGV